jgi:hypothetical protein
MQDYKAMYYLLRGRLETAIDVADVSVDALVEIKERLKVSFEEMEEIYQEAEEIK